MFNARWRESIELQNSFKWTLLVSINKNEAELIPSQRLRNPPAGIPSRRMSWHVEEEAICQPVSSRQIPVRNQRNRINFYPEVFRTLCSHSGWRRRRRRSQKRVCRKSRNHLRELHRSMAVVHTALVKFTPTCVDPLGITWCVPVHWNRGRLPSGGAGKTKAYRWFRTREAV